MPSPTCRRSLSVLAAVVTLTASGALVSASLAQNDRWYASLGLTLATDPDRPYRGGSGVEFSLWRALTDKLEVGGRIGMMSFDSDGAALATAPFLVPGTADVKTADFGVRYYPIGSQYRWFPFIGLGIVVPLDDSFDSEPQALPGAVGVVLDSDWELDSVGFGWEAGVRWDLSQRWFMEASVRDVLLGAESTATVEVVPVVSDVRRFQTDLDSYRFALQIGISF